MIPSNLWVLISLVVAIIFLTMSIIIYQGVRNIDPTLIKAIISGIPYLLTAKYSLYTLTPDIILHL